MTRVAVKYCKRGHALEDSNRYIAPKTGFVGCKTCRAKKQLIVSSKLYFGGNREAAIKRDGEQCVKCGMTREEHLKRFGYDITVDHIDRNGTGVPAEQRNNSLSNLQTLCTPCHARKDNLIRRLTDNQIVNIRHMKGELLYKDIAKLYGITPSYVSHIMRGVAAKHLLPKEAEL